MTKPTKTKPVTVPFGATPGGETPSIARWAHRAVWTDRMLDTLLHQEVRGGKWHTLIDKVFAPRNLYSSARKVVGKDGAPGVDQQTAADFDEHSIQEINHLHQRLRDDEYQPLAVRRTWISKPGTTEKRPLGIPAIKDRVVQTALVHVIEPILDATFHERSFGFRHERSAHDALRCVEGLLEAGYVFVVDADLKSYFDTIPKDRLLDIIRQSISDSRVLKLIGQYLDQEIMEELKTWTPIAGTPQGAVLSPVLANAYLNPLDHLVANAGFEMVRYADDFVILCRTPDEAAAALALVQTWVTEQGLTLHPTKTQIVDFREESFAFLGYSFRGKHRYPRQKSQQKLQEKIRELTHRNVSGSLEDIIQKINRTMRGWFTYFRHCGPDIYRKYDQRIRARLRRLLLRRHRRNPERLPRQHRWPNAYFEQLGFYSLNDAHARFVQSLAGHY